MEIPRRRLLWTGLTLVLVSLVAAAILRRLQASFDSLEGGALVAPATGSVVLVLFVAAVLASSACWARTAAAVSGRPVSAPEGVDGHVGSWLLKYIPGQVGSLLWKLRWGGELGIARSDAGTAFVYENLFLGISSVAWTVPVLVVGLGLGGDTTGYVVVGVLILAGFVAACAPPTMRALLGLVGRVRRTDATPRVLPWTDLVRLEVWFLLPRVVNGVGFALLLNALHPLAGADEWLLAAATYVLAGIIGILAVFVPSGIGVREGVIVAFASRFVPTEVAVVAAVNARILATLADVALAGVYVLNRRRLSA